MPNQYPTISMRIISSGSVEGGPIAMRFIEPCLSLVLSARAGRWRAGPLDLLETGMAASATAIYCASYSKRPFVARRPDRCASSVVSADTRVPSSESWAFSRLLSPVWWRHIDRSLLWRVRITSISISRAIFSSAGRSASLWRCLTIFSERASGTHFLSWSVPDEPRIRSDDDENSAAVVTCSHGWRRHIISRGMMACHAGRHRPSSQRDNALKRSAPSARARRS